MKSILNITVSCFENCQSTTPSDVSLMDWLTSDKHRVKVEQLRTIQDESSMHLIITGCLEKLKTKQID
jgi:hypothetical protein